MPTIPYVKQGAPFIDHASDPAATFAAADANGMDDGIRDTSIADRQRGLSVESDSHDG